MYVPFVLAASLELKEKETLAAPMSQILTNPTMLPVQTPQVQVYTVFGNLPALDKGSFVFVKSLMLL